MRLVSAISEHIDGFVHPSVANDEVERARHRSFIAAHLAAGLLAFATMPFVLAIGGAATPAELLAFALPLAPLAAALDLSRSGRLDRAHLIATMGLAMLVFVVAAGTGGLRSFAIAWLALIPLEAVAINARRAIGHAVFAAVGVALALFGLDLAGLLPSVGASASPNDLISAVGVLGAVLYAGGLAVRSDAISDALANARRAEGAQYRLVVEHISETVICHATSGAVLFASPSSERLVGAPSARLLGQGLFDRLHLADRPAYLTAIDRAANRQLASTVELRLRRDAATDCAGTADAGFVWIEMQTRPLPAGQDDDPRVVSTLRDINALKALEATATAAKETAERANTARSRFLATVSHELRTPLNAVIGFSELLATDHITHLAEGRREEYTELIHEAGLHLLSIVNGMLDMSKLENGMFAIEPEPFDLEPLVGNCTQLFALKAADAAIKLALNLGPGLPQIVADPRACKQILINLLSNALKFTPPSGEVTVSVFVEGRDIVLIVRDTGVGIAPEDIPRLGEPFFQARSSYDRPYEGTGLGLSVVKGLIGLHGGAMKIESRPGQGTSVTVRLPKDGSASEVVPLPVPGVNRKGPFDDDQRKKLSA